MKLTRKMSPLLMGLVAVLVGCSMMGAALSVLVSTNPASSVATVTIDKALTLQKWDSTTLGKGMWAQEYPFLDDAVTPAVGSTYDINITARSSAVLENVYFFFKITKLDVTGVTPQLILSSDVVVKEYQGNHSTTHWDQLDLESYGDYLLGSFMVYDRDTNLVPDGVAVTAGWSDVYSFMVQFTTTGEYTFDWYASSTNSPTDGTQVHA